MITATIQVKNDSKCLLKGTILRKPSWAERVPHSNEFKKEFFFMSQKLIDLYGDVRFFFQSDPTFLRVTYVFFQMCHGFID